MSFLRLVILLCLALELFGQSERGSITGTITDPGGASVTGATLSVVNLDTNATASAISGSSGEFSVPNLLPGSYRVEIVAQGFKKNVQDRVIVAAASNTRIDAQLQLGQVTETVEVQAAAQ